MTGNGKEDDEEGKLTFYDRRDANRDLLDNLKHLLADNCTCVGKLQQHLDETYWMLISLSAALCISGLAFLIVAFFYALINGLPSKEPVNRRQWKSRDACESRATYKSGSLVQTQ